MKVLRGTARWMFRIAVTIPLVALGGLLLWAYQARSLRDLQRWHREVPEGEFSRADERDRVDLDAYRALEDALFAGLSSYAISPAESAAHSRYERYVAGGPHDPGRAERNWNRTFELEPAELRGGFLLLHGLTDSPYSMRSIAELLQAQGYYVLALRLPGHGTAPAALLDITWRDWAAAVRIGARHVARRVGEAGPLGLGGYSCGGALAMSYVLDAFEDASLPRPQRVLLFSPAIGVTGFARISSWHALLSWIPAFEKSRWLSIEPEFDPYKYNSFPKNAGRQMWELSRHVQEGIAELARNDRAGDLPPVLAFQSVVDATVLARDLVVGFFDRFPANGSELVAFDVNRTSNLEGFFDLDDRVGHRMLEEAPVFPFRFTLVTNESATSAAVVERSRAAGSAEIRAEPLGIAWPPLVYSLSHVALPFPPDDPTYGVSAARSDGHAPLLGGLVLRGEKGVLSLSAGDLLRLRCNPFHDYVCRVVVESLAGER